MTALVGLLRTLSYTGGLFGYVLMAYVIAGWLGDVVGSCEERRAKGDNKRMVDAGAESGKSNYRAEH